MIYPWQEATWSNLVARKQRLPHALLIHGPRGIGKLAFATTLAQFLLCPQPQADKYPCARCASCGWTERGLHPDFHLLQPESERAGNSEESTEEGGATKEKKPSQQISVAQVRELVATLSFSAHRGGARLVVIEPAEALNPYAANALLKTLEEPQAGVVFVLVSHQPHRLLKTISSRCERVVLAAPPAAEAASWLKAQRIEEPDPLLSLAGNSPLEAVRLGSEENRQHRRALVQRLSAPDSGRAIELAAEMAAYPLRQTVSLLLRWCYDLISLRLTGTVRYHIDAENAAQELAVALSPLELHNLYQGVLKQARFAEHPLNPKLYLEALFLPYFSAFDSVVKQSSK